MGMPTNKSQIQMSTKEFEGVAMRVRPWGLPMLFHELFIGC